MRPAFLRLWLLTLAGLAVLLPTPARADRLDLIRSRGEVVIGVKADYVPFGAIDRNGELIGIEPDLAADLARRLGVGLRLVPVTTANRLQKLEEGSVDIVIATLGDTPQRREIATLVEPGYFASGANLMLRPDALDVANWAELKGEPVCATLGALFNLEVAQRYLIQLETFPGNREARLALREGRCVGWLYDDIAILNLLKEDGWRTYRMTLPTIVPTPWAVALARGEAGGPLDRLVGDAVADWHRSGFLLATVERWGVPGNDYLQRMAELWSRRTEDGSHLCSRGDDGRWPAACRDETRLAPEDVTGLHRLAVMLRDATGLHVSFLYRPHEQQQLAGGLLRTLLLILASIALSLAFGWAGAMLVLARIPVLSRAVQWLATVLRMTPPLLQIYLLFFGLGFYAASYLGLNFNGLVVAAICLGLYAGSANMAALADAAETVRRGWQGGDAGPRRTLLLAWPAITASSVNIAKATGMASVIAVPELVYASAAIVAQNGNREVMMNLLLIVYFLLILAVVQLCAWVGSRLARA